MRGDGKVAIRYSDDALNPLHNTMYRADLIYIIQRWLYVYLTPSPPLP